MKTDKLHAGAVFPAPPVRDSDRNSVDISNNPFARPDLEVFVSGLEWICAPENNHPIRGTIQQFPDTVIRQSGELNQSK